MHCDSLSVVSCNKDGDAQHKLMCHDKQTDTPHVLQIEQLHRQVAEQVNTLYYTHRHLHGWQDRELEIV